MRRPIVSLVFAAGVLVQVALIAEPARACAPAAALRGAAVNDPKGSEEVAPAAKPLPVPTPLDVKKEKLVGEDSYKDVFSVLKEDNSCSKFFGGPAKAVEVLNGLALKLSKKSFRSNSVAIQMSGSYTLYQNKETGASYRLFDEAAVNSNGPFVSRIPVPGASNLIVGRFRAHTRQGKALTLLHELGHLVEGADGKWLLPNDGHDVLLSDRNTRTVERHCADQLFNLKD